jgi:ribosomal protein S21
MENYKQENGITGKWHNRKMLEPENAITKQSKAEIQGRQFRKWIMC